MAPALNPPRNETKPPTQRGSEEIGAIGAVVPSEDDVLPCPKCRARETPHCFARITPLYRYHDAARDAVVAAKYPRNSVVARELAVALAARCRARWPDLDPDTPATQERAIHRHGTVVAASAPPGVWVTSVPSPWLRQVRRGGSGTRLLAQFTARALGLPYRAVLRTTRPLAKQALLDDQARRENVGGAFRVLPRFVKRLRDREVLLVDDVMTTGATADEIARVLLDAGARRVSLAVAALAMRESENG